MCVQQQIQRTFPENLKWQPTTLPTIAGNASPAFPASLLSACANLSNYFFRVPLSFGGVPPVPTPPPKSPMTESTIVAMPVKKAESVEIMIIICSQIKIRIFSDKGLSLSKTFSRVCLILATCV